MVRGLALTIVMVGLAASSAARAAEPAKHLSVRWNSPDACPDDAQLIGAVEDFLGQPLSEAREQSLSISVSVQGTEGAFSAKLLFTSPQGNQERFLEHPDCSKLTEAVALLAALAIDPERVRARQAAVEQGLPPAEKQQAPAPNSDEKPAPATPADCPKVGPAPAPLVSKPRYITMSVAGFVSVGALPRVGPGLSAELGARFERFRAVLVGRYWAGSSADVSGTAPLSIALSLATAGLRGCGLPVRGEWSVLGCLGADLGSMSGSGQGVDDAHTKHALFGSLEASVFAAYSRIEPAPFAGLGLAWVVARPPFGISRGGVEDEAFRPSRLGFMGYLGLSYGL